MGGRYVKNAFVFYLFQLIVDDKTSTKVAHTGINNDCKGVNNRCFY